MGSLNLLIIGPFPDPITGVSIANKTFVNYLLKKEIKFSTIDTNSHIGISSRQGSTFSFAKAFEFIKTYLKIHRIFSSNVVYITPGQTFYGVIKYMPFIVVSIVVGRPYIIHLHGNYLGREYKNLKGIKKIIFRFLISKARFGIALSPSLRKNFDGLLAENKIVVVENFVSTELFTVEAKEKTQEILKILYLSNLMEEKGILDVLNALLILKDRQIKFKATIAGEVEKRIESDIKLKLELLKPEATYIDVVKGDSKTKALVESNVFLLPTYYKMEGQPISILEAMATGNLIVTTRHAGIPDIVDEKNAIFVEVRKPEDIAEKLAFVSANLGLLSQYSAYNIEATRHRFTEELFGAKLMEIVKNARA